MEGGSKGSNDPRVDSKILHDPKYHIPWAFCCFSIIRSCKNFILNCKLSFLKSGHKVQPAQVQTVELKCGGITALKGKAQNLNAAAYPESPIHLD